MIVSRCMYISQRVGYLSELTSYLRYGRVTGCFYPWMDNPSEEYACCLVLENDDNFAFENDDCMYILDPGC